jgi:hypothetical protein
MTIIPADNSLAMSGSYIVESSLAGDLWPYNGKTELTNTSTPAAKVNTGTYMSKPITEITKNSDGTVSFWFIKAPATPVTTPTNLSANVEGETSATISWEPGDENAEAYTLEVTKHRDSTATLVGEYDFTTGSYNGWNKANSAEFDSTNGVKLASNSNPGSITSPSFTTDVSGEVTIMVNAKNYGSDSSTLTVSLSTGASTTVTLTNEFADYCVVLKGTADTSTTVKLSAASKKRCYIRNASIYTGNNAENAPARVTETSTTYTRTFAGITDTSYQVTGLEAGTLYDYRVKATTTDTEFYTDSEWTAYSQFTTEGGDENGEENGGDENGGEDPNTPETPTVETVDTPVGTTDAQQTNSSVTISWDAITDYDVTYSVELTKQKVQAAQPSLLSSTDFTSSSHGWTKSSSGIGNSNSNGTQLGSNSNAGSLTSPVFTTDNLGAVSVTVNSKYMDSNSYLTVKLLDESGTSLDNKSFSQTNAYKDYTAVFTDVTPYTSVKVQLSAAKSKRIYVKSADIYLGDITASSAAPKREQTITKSGDTILIEGITDNQVTVTDLEEGATYDYRIKAVPVDTEHYEESEWSAVNSFTLGTATAIDSIDADADASDADAAYYTLGGLRLTGAPTAPGLYIRRTATRVTKHVVK